MEGKEAGEEEQRKWKKYIGNQYRRWVGKEIERKQNRNRNERKEGKEAGKEEQRKWKK